MSKAKINPRGSSQDELEKQLLRPEEIAESKVRVDIKNMFLQKIHYHKEKIITETIFFA